MGPPNASNSNLPLYNQLHLGGGVQFGLNETPQIQLQVGGRPHQNFVLGGIGHLAPTNRFGGGVYAGGRFDLTRGVGLQFQATLGLSNYNNYSVSAGTLAENVQLNGLNFFINPEVRVLFQPINSIHFYIGLGASIDIPTGVRANPATLMGGENPVGVRATPTLTLGINFEILPNRRVAPEENPEENRRSSVQTPIPQQTQAFSNSVDERLRQITRELNEERQAQVNTAVDTVRDQIVSLQSEIVQLNQGMNLANQAGRTIGEISDFYAYNQSGSINDTQRQQLRTQLQALLNATQLSSDGTPRDNSSEASAMRNGLRLVYNSTARHLNSIGAELNYLRDQMRNRNEAELSSLVEQTLTSLRTFSDSSQAQATQMRDFQPRLEAINTSMNTMSTLGTELHLEENSEWQTLRTSLEQTRDQLGESLRSIDAIRQLTHSLNGGQNFGSQVNTSERALATFQRTLTFVQQMSSNDAFRGVTLEILRSQFGHAYSNLVENLNRFIIFHNNPTDRRSWNASLVAAQNLLCQLDSAHAQCRTTIARPTVRPERPARVIRPTQPVQPAQPPSQPQTPPRVVRPAQPEQPVQPPSQPQSPPRVVRPGAGPDAGSNTPPPPVVRRPILE
ncbi:MAG: hypothetical protein JNK65_00930 [Deltaproteobacteria bacterium]|nr:hypothetical protein [Deltaproteobacteria bacterium]